MDKVRVLLLVCFFVGTGFGSAGAESEGELVEVRVTSFEGGTRTVRIPAGVWTVKGCLGTVRLPAGVIREIRSDENVSVQRVLTVYGETFLGKVTPRSVTVSSREDMDVREQRRIVFPSPKFAAPSRAAVWRLKSGDVFCAWFADREIAMIPENGDGGKAPVSVDSIRCIARTDNCCMVITDNDRMLSRRPFSRNVEVVLLSNGMRHRVPWKQVDSVVRGLGPTPDERNLSREAGGREPRGGRFRKVFSVPGKWFRVCRTKVGRVLRVFVPKGWQAAGKAGPGTVPAQEETVFVRGGTFGMGSERGNCMEDESPVHDVTLSDFIMDACEITKAQFAEFISDTGYKTDAEEARSVNTWQSPGFLQMSDEPVVCVSWHDAVRFCNWRSKRERLERCYKFKRRGRKVICHRGRNGYRLPTEAEWEYAAGSGGKDVTYPWGHSQMTEGGGRPSTGSGSPIGERSAGFAGPGRLEAKMEIGVRFANFRQGAGELRDKWAWTNPVKAFPSNTFALYGMGGNVWEWCQDWYSELAYTAVHRRQSHDPCVETDNIPGLSRRVMRGGSFANELDMLRCAGRGSGLPHASANRVGFRCVKRVPSARTTDDRGQRTDDNR